MYWHNFNIIETYSNLRNGESILEVFLTYFISYPKYAPTPWAIMSYKRPTWKNIPSFLTFLDGRK